MSGVGGLAIRVRVRIIARDRIIAKIRSRCRLLAMTVCSALHPSSRSWACSIEDRDTARVRGRLYTR